MNEITRQLPIVTRRASGWAGRRYITTAWILWPAAMLAWMVASFAFAPAAQSHATSTPPAPRIVYAHSPARITYSAAPGASAARTAAPLAVRYHIKVSAPVANRIVCADLGAKIPLAPQAGPTADRLCRHAYRTTAGYDLGGAPSASVEQIWQAWHAMGSPLADNTQRWCDARGCRTIAEYFYDAGVSSHIDPNEANAIVRQESCYQTAKCYGSCGWACVTGSLGNIRCHGVYACIPLDGGYTAYHNPWQAIDDLYAELVSYRNKGLTTPDLLTPIWAPSGDHNNPTQYAQSMRATMDTVSNR